MDDYINISYIEIFLDFKPLAAKSISLFCDNFVVYIHCHVFEDDSLVLANNDVSYFSSIKYYITEIHVGKHFLPYNLSYLF